MIHKQNKSRSLSDAALADREWERLCGDVALLAPDWLWETDADLRIVYISERSRRILDVDLAFVIGKRPEEFMEPLIDSVELKAHQKDLLARKPIREFTYKKLKRLRGAVT